MNTCSTCKYYDHGSPVHTCRRYPKSVTVENRGCGEHEFDGPSFEIFEAKLQPSKPEKKDVRAMIKMWGSGMPDPCMGQGWNECCDAWEAYLKDVRLDEWLEEMGIIN